MASLQTMYCLADDPTKDIVVLINDYYDEYGPALQRLSERLGRPLRGLLLVSKTLKEQGRNLPDKSGVFKEVVCDFSNDANLRATIREFENNLLLVTCPGESSQMDFQRALPHLPYVAGPSERSLEWATHKGKMREILGAYDSKLTPKVQPVTSAADTEVRKVLSTLSFPMIIKPTGLSDSTLVTKVHNEAELRSTLRKSFAALLDTYRRNRGNGKPGIIVEEFIEGDLYSIDGYVNESGKVWFLPLLRSKSAYHMGLQGFYIYQTETYHELTSTEDAAGRRAAEDAIHAIGLRSSVAHIELYKTARGWKIVEIGARGGALRHEVYEASYGVNHAFNEFLIKAGLEPELDNGLLVHSMVFKVYPEREGTVQSVEGVTVARRKPSVYKIDQFVKPGDGVLPITNGGSVAVQGVLFHHDVTRLREEVAQVRESIILNIGQPSGRRLNTPRKKQLHPVA